MKQVYDITKHELTTQTAGDNVKDGRWWNFQERSKRYLRHRGIDVTGLMHHGHLKRWWPNFDSSPLNNVFVLHMPGDDGEAEHGDAADIADGANVDEAAGNAGSDNDIGPTSHRQSVEAARRAAARKRQGSSTLNYCARRRWP